MSDQPKAPPAPETFTPIVGCRHGGLGVHDYGDRQAVERYQLARDGEDLRGQSVWVPKGGGREHVKLDLGGGSGPAQVASPKYRDGWEQTFGKRGAAN